MRNDMEIAKHSVGNLSFENSWSNMTYHWEVNLLKIKILFSYLENILISRLYEQFSRKWSNLSQFLKFEKFQTQKNMNISYIILKHMIWRFRICGYFREIFKFRHSMSTFLVFSKYSVFHKVEKFQNYFAKQIINSNI